MNRNSKVFIVVIIALVLGAMTFFKSKQPETNMTEAEMSKEKKTHPHDHQDHKLESVAPEATPPSESPPVMTNELSVSMNELPTLSDLEGLTDEEVHHTAEFILEAGRKIGLLIEEADSNPVKREETLKFLKSCAENVDLVPAIRAVCWKKTMSQITIWKIFLPISDAKVSDEIKNLASQLP